MKKTKSTLLETKKMVLDALCEENEVDHSIGIPSTPVLPLVGSMNVPISQEEENECE